MNRMKTLGLIAMMLLLSTATFAQTFNSGSDGSDGALNLTTPGTVIFDPVAMSLDSDGDGVYHFTTINVATGVTVRLGGDILGSAPVIWLASGAVTIDGVLDLDGEAGSDLGQLATAANPGAGGYRGGIAQTLSSGATNGSGPGGGIVATPSAGAGGAAGGGAGHLFVGGDSSASDAGTGGESYGNQFLQPLLGGSGGSGGGHPSPGAFGGAGGGAGGGAILIASSGTVTVGGTISVNGGDGGGGIISGNSNYGGGGSGGSIRLMANTVSGAGTLSTQAGNGPAGGGEGSRGRVRLEAFNHGFTGTIDPGTVTSSPGLVFPPATAPRVRVTSVDGVALPANPLGGFAPADILIDASGSVTIAIEANYVPLGTVVELTFVSEGNQSIEVTSTPLAGSLALSTATATATIPHGFAIFNVQASWTP